MQFKQRIISIRDKNQPNTAPTIMVSHGNPFTDYTTMFNTIADLVMRGYNVIFYETSASEGLFLSPQPVVPCGDASAVTFQRMAYTGYQHAYAATQYVKQNATTYNVDVNKLFLLGGSFSGFASLTLAYADSGNFTHNIFHNSAYGTDLGTKSALVKTGVPDLGEHTFKGVCVTAGGFPGTKTMATHGMIAK
ncbi:MAG: hypothetical protein IPN94_26235 [Sphingobacteriales bacterium]|nr:hypothetical protein [Sphingobacteriales bacterium]